MGVGGIYSGAPATEARWDFILLKDLIEAVGDILLSFHEFGR